MENTSYDIDEWIRTFAAPQEIKDKQPGYGHQNLQNPHTF
jgi:hypothetical protein